MNSVLCRINRALAPHRLLRIRKRYLFTRRNTLRLRYIGVVVACLLVSGVTGVNSLFTDNPSLVGSQAVASLTPPDKTQIRLADNTIAPMPQAREEKELEEKERNEKEHNIVETVQKQVSAGIRKASESLSKPERPPFRLVEIGRGDTLAGVLQNAGLSNAESFKIVEAMSAHYDPRQLKPGQKVRINYTQGDDQSSGFASLGIKIDPVRMVKVLPSDDNTFDAEIEEKELKRRLYAGSARIETSLYGSAARSGLPAGIIAEVIRAYSWTVDFQRDLRRGDTIEVLYEAYETEEGELAHYGDVLHASLSVDGQPFPVYRFEKEDGFVDYYEPHGHSVKKTLMKTPVNGARLSSGYGMRMHPILGYNKMHKGLDFAAPTGTPIYAAGDGIVEYIGRRGGYGNYIRLRHNVSLKTAYAHLHKYAKGLKVGDRVEQGDVIGYVGSTGRSTGPHLHYEVLVSNKQVNPRSVDLPVGEQLAGRDLKKFKDLVEDYNQQYVALTEGLKYAEARERDVAVR